MDELMPCKVCRGTPNVHESTQHGVTTYGIYHACASGDSVHIRSRLTRDEAIDAWNRFATPEDRPLLLPAVSERDRQSIYDFLHDCFAEWINDPSVGLRGMNAAEAVLANSIMSALASGSEESKPLTPEQLPELVGNPVWISGINQYGILGCKGVDADDDGNPIFRYVVGFAFGWEWLDDVLRGDRKAYTRKPDVRRPVSEVQEESFYLKRFLAKT